MCQFRRRYLLPCLHMFHLNAKQTVFAAGKWRLRRVFKTLRIQQNGPLNRFWCPDIVRVVSLLRMLGLNELPFHQLNDEILKERHIPVVGGWMQEVHQTLHSLSPNESSMDNCGRFVRFVYHTLECYTYLLPISPSPTG